VLKKAETHRPRHLVVTHLVKLHEHKWSPKIVLPMWNQDRHEFGEGKGGRWRMVLAVNSRCCRLKSSLRNLLLTRLHVHFQCLWWPIVNVTSKYIF